MDVSKQDEILSWVGKSITLLIKKLSRNDCLWAEGREYGHQNGVYVPKEVRESGFFPQLLNTNPAKPHIFESSLISFWPETGETKTSSLKHYSNKGPEMHFTGVPKALFSGLTPASLLLGGRLKQSVAESDYWFITVDSASEEAELVESMFDLGSDFHFGLFDPAAALSVPQDETEALIRDLSANLSAGTLQTFINSVSTLPSSESLAAAAQESYMKENGLQILDPFAIPNPGDAIMRISRDIEFELYKRAELRHRAAEVARAIERGVCRIFCLAQQPRQEQGSIPSNRACPRARGSAGT